MRGFARNFSALTMRSFNVRRLFAVGVGAGGIAEKRIGSMSFIGGVIGCPPGRPSGRF